MINVIKAQKGFTLLEILLYFAIVGVILVAIFTFSFSLFDLTGKSDVLHELQTNVGFIVNKISKTAKQAESIND